jgi:lipoate-protein ligase A
MPSGLVARYLKQPARQPDYRENRPHGTFLRTIDVPPEDLKQAIANVWNAASPLEGWPEARLPGCIRQVLERSNQEPPPPTEEGNAS